MRKSRKLLISIQIILFTSLALVISFAWIPRNWSPEVNYSDITLQTTGSLVVSFDKNSNFTNVDLNQYQDIEKFMLKQVSSNDGIHFVGADFSPIVSNGVPVYNNVVEGKYIETKFTLKTLSTLPQGKTQYIFLTSDSVITMKDKNADPKASNALRVSINIKNGTIDEKTVILANPEPKQQGTQIIRKAADSSLFDVNATPKTKIFDNWPSDKKTLNAAAVGDQVCYSVGQFNGGGKGNPTKENTLTSLNDKNTSKEVTVRIWLEGCDPDCVNEIVGSSLKLKLKFNSKIV